MMFKNIVDYAYGTGMIDSEHRKSLKSTDSFSSNTGRWISFLDKMQKSPDENKMDHETAMLMKESIYVWMKENFPDDVQDSLPDLDPEEFLGLSNMLLQTFIVWGVAK